MLRVLYGASRLACSQYRSVTAPKVQNLTNSLLANQNNVRNFTSALLLQEAPKTSHQLLQNPMLQLISKNIISRNLIKYSFRKGKRKSCKAVLRRFYRLNWGGWIRTKCGRQKKLWMKSPPRKRRLRQHVLCNATQSTLLDKMAGAFWRKPRYYVADPYEPYHTREEFQFTYVKPKPFFPPQK